MNLLLLTKTAFRSLNNHKTRSLLTTLGIIIGIVSIIAVMSIGQGAKYKVKKEIEKLGTNFMIVLASAPKNFGQRGGVNLTLKKSDVAAITTECDDVNLISPGVLIPVTAVYEGANWQTSIYGVAENYTIIRNWKLTNGNFFTDQEVRAGAKVAVLGKTVAREVFDSIDPIGKTIRIKKLPFKVVGVMEEMGKTPDGRDQDDAIFVPITTAQRKLKGTDKYSALLMSSKNKDRLGIAAEQVRSVLRQQHKLDAGDEDDFTLFTQDDISKASDAASEVLNILLLVIASISLLVGGIGIMNIMLVSVTERTKEIGIRMALGATTAMILRQFLIEAVAICLFGGTVGIALGIGVAELVGSALSWPIVISMEAIGLSLGSSIIIGLFFGYYPAHKAAHLNPIDALIDR